MTVGIMRMLFKVTLASAAVAGAVAVPSLVAAQQVIQHTDGFVCPVFNADSQAGANNPNAANIGGGDTSIIGPNVSVPTHATNGDGSGTPPGPHSSTGDSDYSAIWSG